MKIQILLEIEGQGLGEPNQAEMLALARAAQRWVAEIAAPAGLPVPTVALGVLGRDRVLVSSEGYIACMRALARWEGGQ